MSVMQSLPTLQVEKVWGRTQLPAPFAAGDGQRIGEIWFAPAPPCDALLAKYLFTSEKLSVQVHPNDAQAPDGLRGKEECWLVLDAEPGATLAIGFKEPITPEAMRAAALDGSIEHMLDWHPVRRGDFFYLPAGTVHAIGPGLSLVEIQQNSDITYRLFDYGRPRELHLDAALAVAHGAPYDPALRKAVNLDSAATMVDGPHFRLDLVADDVPADVAARYGGPLMVLPLAGSPRIDGTTVNAGECAIAEDISALALTKGDRALVTQAL